MFKRVIFQDIDGVLNTMEYLNRVHRATSMDPVNVARMRAVVEKTGAQLVISSAWRTAHDWEEIIRSEAAKAGWADLPIIGRTGESHSRGAEIDQWLKENPTEDFVIVDDNVWDMFPSQASHVVECDDRVGFSEANRQTIEQRWA
ncbi:MAG: hypothetical protein G01um101419_100 [Parcubacteria group bacterium Gr01-1014_19]|nr:MAG: hypothetical protein G01um101419_100 [Parcubacteria group bacterium Gr01-1014_19]